MADPNIRVGPHGVYPRLRIDPRKLPQLRLGCLVSEAVVEVGSGFTRNQTPRAQKKTGGFSMAMFDHRRVDWFGYTTRVYGAYSYNCDYMD